MAVVLDSRADFTLEAFHAVSREGAGVRFSAHALARMAEARSSFLKLLEDPEVVIYGVTSGYGQMAHLRFSPDERKRHAARPPDAAGTSFGPPLPERVVRGIVFARLANYVEGHAAITPGLAEKVAGMLDDHTLPQVPALGNGSAGEILALSHLFSGLAHTVQLREKDSLSLINGSPCATALVADGALSMRRRLDIVLPLMALAFEAMLAPLEQIDAALEGLWGDPFEAAALSRLRSLTAGGAEARRPYQAPVSWRIMPRILGRALHGLSQAEETSAIALRAVTDNPIYIGPDAAHPNGRVLSNGGYHNARAPAALDRLSADCADLAMLCDRYATKLLDGKVSLLPHQLMTGDGYIGTVGFSAAAFAEQARMAASPTLLPGSEGGGFGQNDVASPVFAAWRKCDEAGAALESALGCLAVVVSQAFHATGREAPPALNETLDEIREFVAPVDTARALGPEMERLAGMWSRKVRP